MKLKFDFSGVADYIERVKLILLLLKCCYFLERLLNPYFSFASFHTKTSLIVSFESLLLHTRLLLVKFATFLCNVQPRACVFDNDLVCVWNSRPRQ